MCGRYALTTDPRKVARYFGAEPPTGLRPRYNVAPSQDIPILYRGGEGRRFALARWGLVLSWSKEARSNYSTINAHAETVTSIPAFRHLRCLTLTSGYFEWQAQVNATTKQPWFIALNEGEFMGFAGLWEHWKGVDGQELESCCIIGTEANALTLPIHDRMPLILDPSC